MILRGVWPITPGPIQPLGAVSGCGSRYPRCYAAHNLDTQMLLWHQNRFIARFLGQRHSHAARENAGLGINEMNNKEAFG